MSTTKPMVDDLAKYVTVQSSMQVKNAEFIYTLGNVKVLEVDKKMYSPICSIAHFAWYFEIRVHPDVESKLDDDRTLGLYLHCEPLGESLTENLPKSKEWSCSVSVELKVFNQEDEAKSVSKSFQKTFHPLLTNWGFSKFMKWSVLTTTDEGFIKGDTVIFKAHLKDFSPFYMSNPSKST